MLLFGVLFGRQLLCGLSIPQILQRLDVVERPSSRREDTIHLGGTNTRAVRLPGQNHLNPRVKYFVRLTMQLFKLIDYLLSPEVEIALASSKSGQIPLNPNVDLLHGRLPPADATPLPVDFERAAEKWQTSQTFLVKEFALR